MNSIHCLQHEGQQLLFFLPQSDTTQYLCEICLHSFQEQQNLQKYQKAIQITKALTYPEYLISKLDIDKNFFNYFIEVDNQDENFPIQQLKKIEQEILEMQSTLTKLYQDFKLFFQSYQDLQQKIRNDLKQVIFFITKIVKLDQLKEIINSLNQLGDTVCPQAIKSSEQNLHQYIKGLIQNNGAYLNDKIFHFQVQKLNQFKDLKKEKFPDINKINEIFKQISEQHCNLNKFINRRLQTNIKSNLLKLQYLSKIQDYIERKTDKTILQAQLIYQGTKDGLNGQIFLAKVNGKNNLLFVFKSSSGAIFGSYTPCKWVKMDANYQFFQDDSCSSFIFSQTHDQIYPLKQERKQYAICRHKDYPIAFGGGHDLQMNSDFQTGFSYLGNTYQCDQGLGLQNIYLFGQAQPNIQEFEVFELIFI
ncbi:unnamed protein product [Paramecium sonneborni]|uniref:TLDc domain-containing protein n=1 Tax=Paramecium sonneborni TaxID=65129 RepID=A0A8S1RNW8_9CILI|nr:unnamed protein product [Paramecium sonneborni]